MEPGLEQDFPMTAESERSDTIAQAGGAPHSNLSDSLKLLMRYGRRSRLLMCLSALLATLAAGLELVPVWVVSRMVSAWASGGDTSFVSLAVIALAAVLAGHTLMGFAMAMSHLAAFRLIHSLMLALARHLARLPMGWFLGRRSGGAKKLIVDEPERMELMIAHGIPEGISAIATWLAVTIWLFVVDWRMALAAIALTPLSFLLIVIAMSRQASLLGLYQRLSEQMNGAIVEYLAGMPVIKVFNRTGVALSETSRAVRAYAAIETDMARGFLPLGTAFYTLVVANICVILPAGLLMMKAGWIDLAQLCFFVILGSSYSQPLMKLFNLLENMAHISMASVLIAEALDTPKQADTRSRVDLSDHSIAFEDVRFTYDTREVLHGLSFTAPAGTMTALVGPSGAGKSTVASLIPRLFDPDAGRVRMGGVDLRDIGLDQLMEQVAFVFQKTFLFSGTIGENIRFGKHDASEAELYAAARAARAHDFIMALPNGYDTKIGDGGTTLSGGEHQRIALARAILKDAPVIVLDEATSFADPDSEAEIQEALDELVKDRTVIVVAHRLHTIMNADQIVVLENGSVAETGRHEDLVERNGLYAELWEHYSAVHFTPLRAAASKGTK